MASRGRSARKKGHNFECKCAQDFRGIGYDKCITSRQGNRLADENGIDLLNTGGFDIQCKNYASYRPVGTIFEIHGHKVPIVITNAARQPTMAIIPWKDLMNLIKVNGDNKPDAKEDEGTVESVVLPTYSEIES